MRLRLTLAAALLSLVAGAHATAPKATLKPFASEAELLALFNGWAEEHKRRLAEQRSRRAESPAAAAAVQDSVTNVQHAGVDEGGIVKLHGDHLVILRRGRLFTVKVGDRALKPVAAVDAFGPDVDPRGAWYDEMLIWGNTIAVIGYSYQRGGTELALFDLSDSGQLRYRSTHHLRSNDYYSSRNYASRLIGSKLVFYTPLYLNPWSANPYASLPAMRPWRKGATEADFKRIAPATRIYRTDEPLDPYQGIALHSVSICDLAQRELSCEGSAVLAPAGRVFYVSPNSVFVWTTPWARRIAPAGSSSAVFRIPLDGAAPSVLKVAGSPIDQFSFLEGHDGFLNVLVRAGGWGDGMWAAEVRAGSLALLRVPLASFSDGRDSAPRESYRDLPSPGGHSLQSRYIGDYLLYGAGAGWHRPQAIPQPRVYALRFAHDEQAHDLRLLHGVDRIEALGSHAVVVGSDGKDLHFTSLWLGAFPVVAGRYARENASQGETRSHGFFYKAESESQGLIGLPIIGGGKAASRQLRHESASLLYLRNSGLTFEEIGTLDSHPLGASDGCRASCVDWYGNSRPLFLKGRIFALMGYEIVEGEVHDRRIRELRRISFAPGSSFHLSQ